MIRLGLCCAFVEEPIRFRTTTATYLLRLPDPLAYLNDIVSQNIEALDQAIAFCIRAGIRSFRVNSQFLPAATHPLLRYTLNDLPSAAHFKKRLKELKKKAQDGNIRLTFHPDQFVNLSAEREEVIESSIRDLEYHATLADFIGADVINIHAGGSYGDKVTALKRFAQQFKRLSKKAQKCLTLENDDKTYSPSELLPLCQQLEIPLVYDVHHHRCLKDNLSIEEATQAALLTWDREPLFHLSSPLEGWNGPKAYRHHDFIQIEDVPACWKKIHPLTIEIEAKAKEKAVLQLLDVLSKQKWNV